MFASPSPPGAAAAEASDDGAPTNMTIVTSNTVVSDLSDQSTSSSAYGTGATILESVAPSSITGGGTQNLQVRVDSSLALSLNPSMVDSAALLPSTPSASGTHGNASGWIGLHQHPNQASLSEWSVSSGDSCSTPSTAASPYILTNIGRSLALASVESHSGAGSAQSSRDAGRDDAPSKSPVAGRSKGVQWWDQLRTDEDWESFRRSANDHLKLLVAEEMESRCNDAGKGVGAGDVPANKVGSWFQGLYQALASSIHRMISEETASDEISKYVSSLVKEIADIQQQLDSLPPTPPALPGELSLGDLPPESRAILIKYQEHLEAWRGEVTPQREGLTRAYTKCQEKLLSAIIDAEEAQFWDKRSGADHYSKMDNYLGSVNDDGYVEVVDKKSPLWCDLEENAVNRQSKFQLKLGAAFFAALTAGAGFFLTLQSKRGCAGR